MGKKSGEKKKKSEEEKQIEREQIRRRVESHRQRKKEREREKEDTENLNKEEKGEERKQIQREQTRIRTVAYRQRKKEQELEEKNKEDEARSRRMLGIREEKSDTESEEVESMKIKAEEEEKKRKDIRNLKRRQKYALDPTADIKRSQEYRDHVKSDVNYADFETNIESARELLAEMSGFNYWRVGSDVNDEDVAKQVRERIITDEVSNRCIAGVLNEIHIETPIYDCACCGKKESGTFTGYAKDKGNIINLRHEKDQLLCAPLLMVANEAEQPRLARKKGRNFPVAEHAKFYREYYETFSGLVRGTHYEHYEKVFNHYIYKDIDDKKNPVSYRYALHPELVSKDQRCRLCNNCLTFLKKGALPPFSIRAGYDFGNLARVGLPDLSDVAKVVLGQCSGFGASIVKLKQIDMNKIITEDNMWSAVTGHFIVFGPELITPPDVEEAVRASDKAMFKDRIISSINVSFVGSIPNWNIIKEGIKERKILSRIFSLDVDMLRPWIHYLTFREDTLLSLQSKEHFLRRGDEHLLRLLQLHKATNLFENENDMKDLLDGILDNCQVCSDPETVDIIERTTTADYSMLPKELPDLTDKDRDRTEIEDVIDGAVDRRWENLSKEEKEEKLKQYTARADTAVQSSVKEKDTTVIERVNPVSSAVSKENVDLMDIVVPAIEPESISIQQSLPEIKLESKQLLLQKPALEERYIAVDVGRDENVIKWGRNVV